MKRVLELRENKFPDTTGIQLVRYQHEYYFISVKKLGFGTSCQISASGFSALHLYSLRFWMYLVTTTDQTDSKGLSSQIRTLDSATVRPLCAARASKGDSLFILLIEQFIALCLVHVTLPQFFRLSSGRDSYVMKYSFI